MMDTNVMNQLKEATLAMKKKKAGGLNYAREMEKIRNLAVNHIDEILSAQEDVARLTEEVEELRRDLHAADEEYSELNKKYRTLEATVTKKPKGKVLTGVVEEGVTGGSSQV